jgi:hypothetical protein
LLKYCHLIKKSGNMATVNLNIAVCGECKQRFSPQNPPSDLLHLSNRTAHLFHDLCARNILLRDRKCPTCKNNIVVEAAIAGKADQLHRMLQVTRNIVGSDTLADEHVRALNEAHARGHVNCVRVIGEDLPSFRVEAIFKLCQRGSISSLVSLLEKCTLQPLDRAVALKYAFERSADREECVAALLRTPDDRMDVLEYVLEEDVSLFPRLLQYIELTVDETNVLRLRGLLTIGRA